MFGHAIDGRAGDVDEALDPRRVGSSDDVAAAVNVGGEDVGLLIEGKGGGGVDDDIRAGHRRIQCGAVADVALDLGHPVAFGVVEGEEVEGGDTVAASQEMPDQVDAEEAGAAGDKEGGQSLAPAPVGGSSSVVGAKRMGDRLWPGPLGERGTQEEMLP